MPQYSGVFRLSQVTSAVRNRNWPSTVTPTVEYLVVSGGGGGSAYAGGGGGGLLSGFAGITPGSAVTVTIGSGGTGTSVDNTPGGLGNTSVFGSITPRGGGGGGGKWTGSANGTVPITGGSGGGGSTQYTIGGGSFLQLGGPGTPGQGRDGGFGALASGTAGLAGGGGGGAGNHGGDANTGGYPGPGGSGLASHISGTRTAYAGGGGAGSWSNGGAVGGAGGGGSSGAAGTANTGGGGSTASAGGSGIVILSYPDTYAAATSTTGSPTVSTSGSGSISFNGGNSLYLGYGAQTPFSFSTGDFTIEFWVYFNNFTGGPILIDWRAGGANGALPTIYVTAGGVLTYFTSSADRITSSALSTASWYHVVVCRTGTSTKMYVNGAQAGSTYSDSSNYTVNSNGPSIGNPSGTSLNGYMSNIRIVKGNCVYTGAFTVPKSPLTATQPAGTNISAITGTQTSLLLNSVSGAYLADSSTNSYAATVTGSTIAWNSSSPFATGLGYKNRVYTWTSSGSITF